MRKWLPLVAAGLAALWLLSGLLPPGEPDVAYAEFGRLPLLFNGRCQPMDSVARNALLTLRGKQAANLEPWKGGMEHPRIVSGIEWLTTLMMSPEVADAWPVFRVDHPELVSLLKLPGKDRDARSDGMHFSWNQIRPSLPALDREAARANAVSDALRTRFDRAVLGLEERAALYNRLKNTLKPQDALDWPRELDDFGRAIGPGMAAMGASHSGDTPDPAARERLLVFLQRYEAMAADEPPRVVPPRDPEGSREAWTSVGEALVDAPRDGGIPDPVRRYAAIVAAFRSGKADAFNRAVLAYRSSLAPGFLKELTKARREAFFNRLQPFYSAMVLYVIAFLLACLSWVNASHVLRRSAASLAVLAFVVHTAGLLFRMWLEGSPPVTNLYSSAVFIGWGAVVLGLVLERFYRDGIGTSVASSVGFVTLIIAHHLSMSGDTMEMMRAVLDTNLWLATHVVAVTTGYASTFVAGFLAVIYVVRGAFTRTLRQETGASLARMVYGIVCFATLFSFVGTVLGGIWADQSWGRFWGWDPKENGALIIVLWNVLILHARWGGMVRERGLMNLAIFGNIVTSWSWFGTNMLGIGLHSYGFMDSAFKWLLAFVASQLALIAIGLLPERSWLSLRRRSPRSDGDRKDAREPGDRGASELAST